MIEYVLCSKGLIRPAGANRSAESLTGDRWPLSSSHKGMEYRALANTNGRCHVTLGAVLHDVGDHMARAGVFGRRSLVAAVL